MFEVENQQTTTRKGVPTDTEEGKRERKRGNAAVLKLRGGREQDDFSLVLTAPFSHKGGWEGKVL